MVQTKKEKKAAYDRAYRLKHKKEIKKAKSLYSKTPEGKATTKRNYQKHKKSRNLDTKEYAKTHKDQRKSTVKRYNDSHKDKHKAYADAHKKEIAPKGKIYRDKNEKEIKRKAKIKRDKEDKVKVAAYNIGYRKDHKEDARKHSRAWKKTVKGKIASKRSLNIRRQLGFNILYPLKEGEVAHHVTNEDVLGIPEAIHQQLSGHSRKKHRTLVLQWLKENDKRKYNLALCALAKQTS